jgi:hypothetical protein
MRVPILFTVITLCAATLSGQGALYSPNSFADRWFQTTEIVTPLREIKGYYGKGTHADVSNRLFPRVDAMQWLYGAGKADHTSFWNFYLNNDNPEWSDIPEMSKRSWGAIYRYQSQFYGYIDSGDALLVNPVLNVQFQPGSNTGSMFQQNTRGLELRGKLANRLSFYSIVTENQIFLPWFADSLKRASGVVAGEGFWKPFKAKGTDFLQARGYLTGSLLKDRVRAIAGHDKLFTGNGIRSLILSDNAKEFLHLRLHTTLGPFRYQNVFARLNGFEPLTGDRLQPVKFMAMHRASVRVFKELELGITEMVVFDRSDSNGNNRFDAEYLNPVIFYRTLESHRGSRDNALMAFDWKWNLLSRFQLYGQVLLDEFNLKYLREKSGWWGNKYGLQTGAKYTTVHDRLGWIFLQAEYNRVRPYTYSHFMPSQSYTHYNQYLAHPLGSNFREWVLSFQYQPKAVQSLFFYADVMLAKRGLDSLNGVNYGNNPLLDNDTRAAEFGQRMFQGYTGQNIRNVNLRLSYMLRHNLFIDLRYIARNTAHTNELVLNKVENMLFIGMRLNFEPRNYLF